MSSLRKGDHYPLRLPAEDAKAVNEVCQKSRSSFNRVVAMCIRKDLAAASGRVSNVDPLPDKVLKRLYAKADDDVDSIHLFIEAQVKSVEE
jgi:hypothetical protein